jgi:hypothetical protein
MSRLKSEDTPADIPGFPTMMVTQSHYPKGVMTTVICSSVNGNILDTLAHIVLRDVYEHIRNVTRAFWLSPTTYYATSQFGCQDCFHLVIKYLASGSAIRHFRRNFGENSDTQTHPHATLTIENNPNLFVK